METETIQKQIEDLKNKPRLTRKERRYLQKLESKLYGNKNHGQTLNIKSILTKISAITLVVLVIAGITWFISSRPNLPPIDLAGHIEQNPSSHILDTEMTEPVQKHMLEHADGDDKKGQGVIVQYNCKKYSCERDLISKLTALVKKYPKNVYLASGNYSGKIILTRLNKREILEKFNDKKIIAFIENR